MESMQINSLTACYAAISISFVFFCDPVQRALWRKCASKLHIRRKYHCYHAISTKCRRKNIFIIGFSLLLLCTANKFCPIFPTRCDLLQSKVKTEGKRLVGDLWHFDALSLLFSFFATTTTVGNARLRTLYASYAYLSRLHEIGGSAFRRKSTLCP